MQETINLLELKCWGLICLLEADGKGRLDGDGFLKPVFGGHAYIRHHPGPGCRAMGILVRKSLRKRVKDIVCGWRSMRIDLRSDCLDGHHHRARSFLFSHLLLT